MGQLVGKRWLRARLEIDTVGRTIQLDRSTELEAAVERAFAELDTAGDARAVSIVQRLEDTAEWIRISLPADRCRRKDKAVDPWSGRRP